VRLRVSVFVKLLMVIIPLVCIPIAVVGYFSIQASVERVNRLVRQEQMVQVEAAAGKINQVFQDCRIALETITRLPVLEDYHLARLFRLQAEAGFNKDNLIRLFKDFLARIPYYDRIIFLDPQGRVLVEAGAPEPSGGRREAGWQKFFQKACRLKPEQQAFSQVLPSPDGKGYTVFAAKPVFTGWRELAGVVEIDISFDKIGQVVRQIHLGQAGYSFLIDHTGRTLIHPQYKPYEFDAYEDSEPSLRQLAHMMTAGVTGWENYTFQGDENVAAFAPIPIMNWGLAVNTPIEEFGREAHAIRNRVIQMVIITLLITVFGVSILSYNFLRPVRRLVAATNRLAGGDLKQEIPVQSRDELGELTISFNRMVRNLSRIQRELVRSEKLISLGRLSAGVAHEIRNPLNAMKGAMVHLQQRWRDEPLIQQYTGLVSEEIDRLNRVVSDFLYFAKQAPPKPKRENINNIILGIQELLADQAAQKGVSFRNDLDRSLPPANLDANQIGQVLLNLVINSLDAMNGNSGEISFRTRLENQNGTGQLRVEVVDQGEGLNEANLASVFDPFFTTKNDGTGLGLPLSMGIVEAHGGSLSLESRPGRGTTATIILPLQGPGSE
jgi:signal transduction histidine kinase